MASITMTASFLGTSALTIGRSPVATQKRVVVASAVKAVEGENEAVKVSYEEKEGGNNGRRNMVFGAAAAAALCSVAGMAVAVEPKRGTPEAKKIYAPVCVTMPTAKICHK